MEKVFKVADIRDLEQKVSLGEISYSRMVEIMNERAYEKYCGKVEKLPIPEVITSVNKRNKHEPYDLSKYGGFRFNRDKFTGL